MSWAELIRLLELGVKVSGWLGTIGDMINNWVEACFREPMAEPTQEEIDRIGNLLLASKEQQAVASSKFTNAVLAKLESLKEGGDGA